MKLKSVEGGEWEKGGTDRGGRAAILLLRLHSPLLHSQFECPAFVTGDGRSQQMFTFWNMTERRSVSEEGRARGKNWKTQRGETNANTLVDAASAIRQPAAIQLSRQSYHSIELSCNTTCSQHMLGVLKRETCQSRKSASSSLSSNERGKPYLKLSASPLDKGKHSGPNYEMQIRKMSEKFRAPKNLEDTFYRFEKNFSECKIK